ncbi:hypothetical protein YC2023_123343 [Brassica napus]
MTAVKDVNTGLGLLHGSIVGQVEVWLGKFKEECSGLVAEAVKQVVEAVNNNANRGAGTPIMKVNQEGGRSAEDEFYDTTIRNVIGNINKYATPPRVTIQNQGVNATDAEPNDVIRSHGNLETTTEGIALSATSHTHNRKGGVNENVMQDPGDGIGHQTADAPNFSLGLTHVINVGGCSVSEKDLIDIAERTRPLTAKVITLHL